MNSSKTLERIPLFLDEDDGLLGPEEFDSSCESQSQSQLQHNNNNHNNSNSNHNNNNHNNNKDTYARSIFDHGEATPWQVASYTLVFVCAMIGHELALEAATTEFSFVDSIAYSVTLFQFAFCLLLPLIVTQGRAWNKFPRTMRDSLPFVRLSAVVFGSTALASQSLKWVSYPTKVVFKSSKLIPTMIVATVMHDDDGDHGDHHNNNHQNNHNQNNNQNHNNSNKYGWIDYLAALLLCVGAAGYAIDSSVEHGPVNNSSLPGLALLVISVLCDAVVPNLQQKLMAVPSSSTSSSLDRLSATELMVNVNAIGFAGLLLYMLVMGQLFEGIRICLEFPRLVVYLTLVGLGLSTAVLAYTRLIQASGSVVAVAVATLRKVATVVLSYIIFPKPLLPIHMAAGVAVIAGILLSHVHQFLRRP